MSELFYSSAKKVVVWLGVPSDNSALGKYVPHLPVFNSVLHHGTCDEHPLIEEPDT